MSAGDPSVIPSALDWLEEGRRVALATVIQTWGSAPRPVGSQLAIDGGGNFLGSVSGGCVEGEVIAEAEEVLLTAKPKTLEFGVEDGTAWKAGLACGGTIRIFVEPLEGGAGEGTRVLHQLAGDIAARRKVALVTELANGMRRLAHAPERSRGRFGAGPYRGLPPRPEHGVAGTQWRNLHQRVRSDHAPRHRRRRACGAGARAHGSARSAIEVLIVDPRAAFATQERFGDVRIEHDWPDEALPAAGLDAATAVVALSHDAKLDDAALISALRSDAFYVGALGSRKTHAGRVERLAQAGIAAADIARIHAPIGLDIGAQGAAEIALSIIAEITAVAAGQERSASMRIAGLVLAGGRSSRMAPRNKLLETVGGEPMVRHVAATALAGGAQPVIVVTGHEAAAVAAALRGLAVTIVANPDYADGLSTSLRAGLRALPQGIDGALILLGDMPEVEILGAYRSCGGLHRRQPRSACPCATGGGATRCYGAAPISPR